MTGVQTCALPIFKNKTVAWGTIKKIINAARLAPSAANLQFLEYLIVNKQDLKKEIFPCTRWGGYVFPRRVPALGERPNFYIVVLINKSRSPKPDSRDIGSAVQNILLSLVFLNLGGCWIASIEKNKLRHILNIPSGYAIDSLIAAGFPRETPILEERSDTHKYWLDENNRLHIPKRPLSDILHCNVLNNRERK